MFDAHATYLETQIKTATPQKLRLMLIDGALRFSARAKESLDAGQRDEAFESLERARDIVGELLAGIRPERHPLNDVARGIYAFLFRSLAEAQLLGEVGKIDEAIRVLTEEQETWRQVCEICPEAPTPDVGENFRAQEVVASDFAPHHPPAAAQRGFSLDA
jgi:flagellar protein FliS